MARPGAGQTVLPDMEDDEEGMPSPQMPPSATDVNLEKLVAFPTWREMLLDLVHTQRMDPWNIDVTEIASKYLERIKNLEIRDLRLPANLILAASILLRFKSDALHFEEDEQVVTPEVFVGEEDAPVEIPMIELRSRIPPRRQVTLDELMSAMEKVFEEQQKREEKAARRMVDIPPAMNISIPEFDIEQEMLELYDKVEGSADKEGLVLFSALADMKNPAEVVYTLLPVLHLAQEKRLSIFQEEFFGEIFVRLIPGRRPPPKSAVARGQMKLSVGADAVLVGQKEGDEKVVKGKGADAGKKESLAAGMEGGMKEAVSAAAEKGAGAIAATGKSAGAAGKAASILASANAAAGMQSVQAGLLSASSFGSHMGGGKPPSYAHSGSSASGQMMQFSDDDFEDRYFVVIPAPHEIVMWVPIITGTIEDEGEEKIGRQMATPKPATDGKKGKRLMKNAQAAMASAVKAIARKEKAGGGKKLAEGRKSAIAADGKNAHAGAKGAGAAGKSARMKRMTGAKAAGKDSQKKRLAHASALKKNAGNAGKKSR